jgi:hypothetical protein
MTAPHKLDPVEPLLRREMFATDEEVFSALIRMVRTGWVGPVEPAPPYPGPGPIARKALAQLGLAHAPNSAPTTPTPSSSTCGPVEDGTALGAEASHVPKAKGRAANAAPVQNSTTSTFAVLPHRRVGDKPAPWPLPSARRP